MCGWNYGTLSPSTTVRGDEFIMDALRIRGHCSAREMQWLNACRMHLRVSRLSEIAIADGLARPAEALKGTDSRFTSLKHDGPDRLGPLAGWTAK
jgi:hypothetical protein